MWGPSFRTQNSSRRRRCSSLLGRAEGASLRKIRQTERRARLRVRLFLCGPYVIPVNFFVPFPLSLSAHTGQRLDAERFRTLRRLLCPKRNRQDGTKASKENLYSHSATRSPRTLKRGYLFVALRDKAKV